MRWAKTAAASYLSMDERRVSDPSSGTTVTFLSATGSMLEASHFIVRPQAMAMVMSSCSSVSTVWAA